MKFSHSGLPDSPKIRKAFQEFSRHNEKKSIAAVRRTINRECDLNLRRLMAAPVEVHKKTVLREHLEKQRQDMLAGTTPDFRAAQMQILQHKLDTGLVWPLRLSMLNLKEKPDLITAALLTDVCKTPAELVRIRQNYGEQTAAICAELKDGRMYPAQRKRKMPYYQPAVQVALMIEEAQYFYDLRKQARSLSPGYELRVDMQSLRDSYFAHKPALGRDEKADKIFVDVFNDFNAIIGGYLKIEKDKNGHWTLKELSDPVYEVVYSPREDHRPPQTARRNTSHHFC